jgi:Flp pilus assembly protein TadD
MPQYMRDFLVPVCIDATSEADAEVPDSLSAVQWTRLPEGQTTTAFVDRILGLLSPKPPPSQPANRSPDAVATSVMTASPHLGYRARANVRLRQLDLTGARADVEMALALSPGNGKVQDDYGNILATFGRLSEAALALNKATELEPQFAVAWMDLGALLCGLHRFTEARQAGDTAVSLAPGDPGGHAVLGTVDFFEGRYQDAQGEFQKIGDGAGLAGVALAEHGLGRETQSQRALQVLIAKHAADAAFQIAEIYAVRGEKDKAIEWLERAYRQRDPGILSITYDPYLDNLRKQPRYMALLRGMHLSE